jgi:hypothetical protein
MRGFLNDDGKNLLGLAYTAAEGKGEKLEKIDRLAIDLALFRMQQTMLARLTQDATDNKNAKATDVAYREILGEIKKMTGQPA